TVDDLALEGLLVDHLHEPAQLEQDLALAPVALLKVDVVARLERARLDVDNELQPIHGTQQRGACRGQPRPHGGKDAAFAAGSIVDAAACSCLAHFIERHALFSSPVPPIGEAPLPSLSATCCLAFRERSVDVRSISAMPMPPAAATCSPI